MIIIIAIIVIIIIITTVGRAAVHNAKSIKLVNDIDLHHTPVDKENAPMLIVGFGKTFTVHDQVVTKDILAKNILNDRHQAPKKLIMRTLARAAMETDKALEEEDMYWLKVEKLEILLELELELLEIHTFHNKLAI